ncbi:MAG: S-methyl-5-thioribose-1-phosphate isomerase [Deltaproteobacteria bacterium]|nr:S-methyl-5-thioribose-1-phosphate isomerase [Deltaproteobacteria bacterium]
MISEVKHIQWTKGELLLLDQRDLPTQENFFPCKDLDHVCYAIKEMVVRGAPAIGITAAYGVVIGLLNKYPFETVKLNLSKTRPTAHNLFWALNRMENVFERNKNLSFSDLISLLEKEALKIHEEDIKMNLKMGEFGASLLKKGSVVLTHCNAGALATGGYGTALGVIRKGFKLGKVSHVFACETRPYLQGARLTSWELWKDHIPVSVITDNMAGFLMKKEKVNAVIVGADRITRNGDVINKIGTYTLSILAREHNIPFYVVAPHSTVDSSLKEGSEVIIEERNAMEVKKIKDVQLTPEEVSVWNPAFDVTPSKYVSAIILDSGIERFPYDFSGL